MKNSNHRIGNRTGDLPYCSAVPQPTAPSRHRFPVKIYYSWSLCFLQRWMTNQRRHRFQWRLINNFITSYQQAQRAAVRRRFISCPEDVDCRCLSNVLTCSLQGSAGTRLYAGHGRTSTSGSSCVSVGDCRRETRHLVNVRIITMAIWRQPVNWVRGSPLNLLHSEVREWRKCG